MQKFATQSRRLILIVLSITLGITPLLNALPVSAADASLWVNGQDPLYTLLDPNVDLTNNFTYPTNEPCIQKNIAVTKNIGSPTRPIFTPQEFHECGVGTNFGTLTRGNTQFMQFKWDKTASRLDLESSYAFVAPNTKALIRVATSGGWRYLSFYTNPISAFQIQPDSLYKTKYVATTAPDKSLKNVNGDLIPVKAFTTSDNGEWLLAETAGGGLTRINLTTWEMTTLQNNAPPYGNGRDPSLHLAISDDGRYVGMSGTNVNSLWVYDLSTCSTQDPSNYLARTTGCGQRNLTDFIRTKEANFVWGLGLRFSADATDLSFVSGTRKISLTAPGINNEQLDYLAMGDSYSSGEGDSSNNGHNYVHGTDGDAMAENGVDTTKEKCHLHEKSYPYLLAKTMNIPAGKFRNIACAGATMNDIVNISNDAEEGYIGHFKQLSRTADISSIKQAALDNSTLGRAAQIQFVAKYKPKVITISIGGNDVGFKDKVESCIMLVLECEIKAPTGVEIAAMYTKLKNLYNEIHNASPYSKLYVVGYPAFVKPVDVCAGTNVLFNQNERVYLDESIKFFNQVAKDAAFAAGAKYLDIEGSLGEKALCGDNEPWGVTGLARGDDMNKFFIGWGNESYHPNPIGHDLMASSIRQQAPNLLTSPVCTESMFLNYCPHEPYPTPEIPTYFAGLKPARIPEFFKMTDDKVLQKGNDTMLDIRVPGIMPNTNVKAEVHSDPIDLGTFTADSNGDLNFSATLPTSLPAGLHTLHLYFDTPAGDKIDLYQTITVLGNEGDIDEDGTPDATDSCPFVTEAGVDHDQDGTDDACDGFVGEPPVDPVKPAVYRARNGDIAKNEIADRIYVERNVAEAAAQLNITGDHDADNDGWALVGQGNTSNSGTPANFWIDENFVPHVSLRHPSKGCVQLTPKNLAVVKANQTRVLKTEAKNTNTCRVEPPSADMDQDGTPDNQQALYRVRLGDVTKGESNKKITLNAIVRQPKHKWA